MDRRYAGNSELPFRWEKPEQKCSGFSFHMSDLIYSVTTFLAFYLPSLLLLLCPIAALTGLITRSFRVVLLWCVLLAIPTAIWSLDTLRYYIPAEPVPAAPASRTEQGFSV